MEEKSIKDGQSPSYDQDEMKKRLKKLGFTSGLVTALEANHRSFRKTYWVLDNSGSMHLDDGHRVVIRTGEKKQDTQICCCSRWRELQTCVDFHIDTAALFNAPTVFMLINDPGIASQQRFSVCEFTHSDPRKDAIRAKEIVRKTRPTGNTPLTRTLLKIKAEVLSILPQLLRDGQKVAIVIATDGLPTDQDGGGGAEAAEEFLKTLKSLESLPVWIVIRLCTDDDEIVSFYNGLDAQLERPLEVLINFNGESAEVYGHNKWLNYALPMHRCREMGYYDRVFDLMDERKLTVGEIREMCTLLFGDKADGIPDPTFDWNKFLKSIRKILKEEKKEWNPANRKVMPWIDVHELDKEYKTEKECCVLS